MLSRAGMPLVLAGVLACVVAALFAILLAGAVAATVEVVLGVGLVVLLVAAYALRRVWLGALAGAAAILFLLHFLLGGVPALDLASHALLTPVLALVAGVLVFVVGGLHYLVPSLGAVGRGARLAGLACAACALLLLGTQALAGYAVGFGALGLSPGLLGRTTALCAAAAVTALINQRLAPRVRRLTRAEGPLVYLLLALSLGYLLLPLPGALFVLLFNGVAFATLGAALSVAVARADRRLLDVAGLALIALTMARFVEVGWPLLSVGVFLMIGATLALSSVLLHLGLRARTPAMSV